MSSRCWTSHCAFVAIFIISSLSKSCLFGVDVSCAGSKEAGSMRSLGLLPTTDCIGVLPLRATCVFLTVAALRMNCAGVICDRVVLSKFLEAVCTSVERNFLKQSDTRFSSIWQGVCGPVGNFLILEFGRSLHITMMMECHVCTDCLPIHLDRIHPFMKFGDDF